MAKRFGALDHVDEYASRIRAGLEEEKNRHGLGRK